MKWRLRIRVWVEEQAEPDGPWTQGFPDCMDAHCELARNTDLHEVLAEAGTAVDQHMAKAWPTGPGTHVHIGPPPVRLVKG